MGLGRGRGRGDGDWDWDGDVGTRAQELGIREHEIRDSGTPGLRDGKYEVRGRQIRECEVWDTAGSEIQDKGTQSAIVSCSRQRRLLMFAELIPYVT